jgi:carbohydrate diacid regulator
MATLNALTPTVAQQIVDKVRGLFDLPAQVCSLEGEALAGRVGEVMTRIPLKQGGRRVADLVFDQRLDASQADVIKSLAELIVQESLTLDDSPYRDEKVDKFIFDLITLSEAGDRELRSRSKLLGIDLKVPRLCMVAILEGIDQERGEDREFVIERTKRGLARCLSSFYTRSPQNEVAYLGGKVFLILKDVSGKESPAENAAAFKTTLDTIYQIFRGDFGSSITVGVGNYHTGLAGLRISFKEAKTAVDLGRQMMGGGRIYHIDDFGVVAGVLSGFEGMPKRENDLISTLRGDHDMARTLSTFFDANLSLTETAERLGIHRNTLVYRLEKITSTLGLDPRRFDEAVQIKLALLMQRFEEEL